LTRTEIEDQIYKLNERIIEQHLEVGYSEDEVAGLQSELEEAETELDAKLGDLEEMEEELSELQEQLDNFDDEQESDEFYSYGAGQTQEETLFDNFTNYE